MSGSRGLIDKVAGAVQRTPATTRRTDVARGSILREAQGEFKARVAGALRGGGAGRDRRLRLRTFTSTGACEAENDGLRFKLPTKMGFCVSHAPLSSRGTPKDLAPFAREG